MPQVSNIQVVKLIKVRIEELFRLGRSPNQCLRALEKEFGCKGKQRYKYTRLIKRVTFEKNLDWSVLEQVDVLSKLSKKRIASVRKNSLNYFKKCLKRQTDALTNDGVCQASIQIFNDYFAKHFSNGRFYEWYQDSEKSK